MSIPDLPDPQQWQPRSTKTETLQSAFWSRCEAAEKLIKARAEDERHANIDNFDSGIGVEEIVREELRRILPSRYSVECGVIVDRAGRTGGDYDMIIFNDLWFPHVKAGATSSSRRAFYPIDGVYAVG